MIAKRKFLFCNSASVKNCIPYFLVPSHIHFPNPPPKKKEPWRIVFIKKRLYHSQYDNCQVHSKEITFRSMVSTYNGSPFLEATNFMHYKLPSLLYTYRWCETLSLTILHPFCFSIRQRNSRIIIFAWCYQIHLLI